MIFKQFLQSPHTREKSRARAARTRGGEARTRHKRLRAARTRLHVKSVNTPKIDEELKFPSEKCKIRS